MHKNTEWRDKMSFLELEPLMELGNCQQKPILINIDQKWYIPV